ncbi:MAG: HNH endonuclease [Planctomycetes bacterium]|nr:HNH endonuclease [Planctomycetota bacterium]
MDPALRELVWQRANGACEYCRLPQDLDVFPFQIDHIIAEKHHGPTTSENLCVSCFHCNVHKGSNIAGLDPVDGRIVRLFDPRIDIWREHFAWAGAEIIGLTSVARATIDVLGINLPERRDHRRLLMEAGSFRT